MLVKDVTFQDYRERMLRVLLHIQQNLDDPLDLKDLAMVAAFSPWHFHRIFRGMVGESVKEHVRRLRLERAASRLKHSVDPVIAIALDSGYETHESFTRAFRKMFGESPSGFRADRLAPEVKRTSSGVHYDPEGDLESFTPLGDGATVMKVELQKVKPVRVAFLRHVGPYDQCGQTWEWLLEWAGTRGMVGTGTRMIGVCHDDPEVTPAGMIRYDACITVDSHFKAEGELGVEEVGGGEYAVTTHFGPYERLGDTYAALAGRWIPRSGRMLRQGPCFEEYLNAPESTDPEDLLTDIYMPLE
jgi:AraC family transcriptional regulator